MAQSTYQCDVCNAVFHTRDDLENHNRTIHSRFRCDLCGEIFDSEAEFDAHLPIAHPEVQQSNSD